MQIIGCWAAASTNGTKMRSSLLGMPSWSGWNLRDEGPETLSALAL